MSKEKYETLSEYLAAEVDQIEDDTEWMEAEYNAVYDWYCEHGFSPEDRKLALARGFAEFIESWDEQGGEQYD